MPKPYPREFRGDVVRVARQGGVALTPIVADFGVGEATVHNWLKRADIENGIEPRVIAVESAEQWELRKRNRLLEQENEVLRRAAANLSQANIKLGSASPK